jgi:hypothetical protein
MKLPAHDKIDHAVYAAGVTALLWALSPWFAIVATAAIVILKEFWWDAGGRGTKDSKDIVAGMIGIVAAVAWMQAVVWIKTLF